MPGLDETRPFVPLRIAVLTLSDRRTLATDTSGQLLVDRLTEAGHELAARALLPDDPALLEAQLRAWIADPDVEVVITTGGTGVTGRDNTPEVIEKVSEKLITGFGELFRWLSYANVG